MQVKKAKELWDIWSQQLVDARKEVEDRLLSSTPESFYNYLSRHHHRLHCYEPSMSELKVGYYGKLIIVDLLYVESGRIFFEKVHYPTSPKYWKIPIAVDNQTMFTKHYVERLIQRKNIETLADLKTSLILDFFYINNSEFVEKVGRLDIACDHLIIQRDCVVFCDYQIQDGGLYGGSLRKSLITNREFKGNQQEIVDYILQTLDVSVAILATQEIPRTVEEASKVIEDTYKRTTNEDRWIDNCFGTDDIKNKVKRNKLYHKYLFEFLQDYDPTKTKIPTMTYT